jgi:hypothetical protein
MPSEWKLSVLAACLSSLGCADFHRGPAPRDAGSNLGSPADPTFEKDVYPVLEELCQFCHQTERVAERSRLVMTGNALLDRAMVGALVVPGDPAAGLLLRRATGEMHFGGQILEPQSPAYNTIADWILNLPAAP